MSRLRKALVAAAAGVAASAALTTTPAKADSFNLVVNYRCTGGIAGNGDVSLRARVTIPTVVRVGSAMNLNWTLEYVNTNPRRFVSPGYYAAGALTSVAANMELGGAWNGVLQAKGTEEQAALQPGVRLETPAALSSSAHLTEKGVIQLRPRAMTVDFLPPEGVITVNNDKPGAIAYNGSWAHVPATPPEYGDHLRDVHTTTVAGDTAKIEFVGTGFEYVGRRMPGVGKVRVNVDGDAVEIDPTLTEGGEPTNAINGNVSLWTRTDLAYGEHTVWIKGLENKPTHLDAFKIHTGSLIEPPTLHRSTCVVTSAPDVVEIVVQGEEPPTSPPPTTTPTTSPTPTGGTTPPPTNGTSSPTTSPTSQITHPHVVGVVPGSTSTSTTSVKPTATKYVRPQVAKTPQGGVDTGVMPDPPVDGSAYGLIAGGSALILGSAAGGLVLWRRRAAHAGGVK
ncbi:MAG TPA: hypothetical protein VFV66_05540 [Nonomuraea sp.]|nr:hypothetical protein [Nonomuraea sp.]